MGETHYPLGKGESMSEGKYEEQWGLVHEQPNMLILDEEGSSWRTRDGRRIPLGKLGDQHLENIISMLARSPNVRTANVRTALAAMNAEWSRRHNDPMKKPNPKAKKTSKFAPGSLAATHRQLTATARFSAYALEAAELALHNLEKAKVGQLADAAKALKMIANAPDGSHVRALRGVAKAALKRMGEV